MKIGKNEACWCGSGKKYKKCHLGRDKDTPLSRGEAQDILGLFTRSSRCSVPDDMKHECQSRIVKAHTLSKGNSLKEIAHNGHVLGFKHGLGNLEKNNGHISLERIGINQASTFTGFCSYHDKKLFSCVEDELFQENKIQCTMLAYRPLMREFYVKEANVKVMESAKIFDKGLPFSAQLAWAQIANENIQGSKLSVRDLTYIKEQVEYSINNKEYSALNHLILRLHKIPSIMACAIHAPITDIFGSDVQDIGSDEKIRPAYIITNLLALDGKGYMIFSWLPEDFHIINKFISAIKQCGIDILGDKLTNYVFTFMENVFVSEEWWELNKESQDYINQLMMQGIRMHMYDLA